MFRFQSIAASPPETSCLLSNQGQTGQLPRQSAHWLRCCEAVGAGGEGLILYVGLGFGGEVEGQEVVLATVHFEAMAGEEEEGGVAGLDGVAEVDEGSFEGFVVEVGAEGDVEACVGERGGEIGGVIAGVEEGLAWVAGVADNEGSALGCGEGEAFAGLGRAGLGDSRESEGAEGQKGGERAGLQADGHG